MKKRILALAALTCVLCVGCGSKAAPAPAVNPTSEVTATPVPTPSPTPKPTPVPTPTAVPTFTPIEIPVLVPEATISQGEQVAEGETLTVDLTDAATYRALNIFLSNFSESHLSAFSASWPDYRRLADFALSYAALNNPKMVEDPDQKDETLNARISSENIQWVMDRFFGSGVISADRIANLCEENGYYYGNVPSDIYGDGFTLVDAITATGYQDEFDVSFHVYSDSSADHAVYNYFSSSGIYSARPNELLESPQGVSLTPTSGSATIQAFQKSDGSLGFHLISYSA